jgi:DNA-binding transcriptional LysR family regulator
MEPRQLAAFLAVAEARHFGRAAERLGVAQPAVSQAIRRLEEDLGVALLERTSHRVATTGAGEAFLPHARAVLAALDDAQRAAADLRAGRAGVLRLVTTPGGGQVLAAVLRAFRAEHPSVRVDLRPARAPKPQAVLGGEVDVALLRTDPGLPGLRVVELWAEPWCVVLAGDHPLAGRDRIALTELADHPLVRIGRGAMSEELLELCRGAGLEPRTGPVLASVDDAFAEIGASRSWTLLTDTAVTGGERYGVCAVAIADDLPPLRLLACVRAEPSPPARAFIALAERVVAGQTPAAAAKPS